MDKETREEIYTYIEELYDIIKSINFSYNFLTEEEYHELLKKYEPLHHKYFYGKD